MENEIITQAKDTTFVDISANQIKLLHDQIFGDAVLNEGAMETLVKLELAYIPFLLFIIIMVVAVNYRWNKSFERIKTVYESMAKDDRTDFEQNAKKFGMLEMQKRNLFDRLFVYLAIWVSSLYIDTMLMAFGFIDFPYISIPMVILVVYKKMSILIKTNSLIGYDDTDIKQKFDGIIDKMILSPIIDGVSNKIRKVFNDNDKLDKKGRK